MQSVLNKLSVEGMTHYSVEGTGRIKADPLVAATHPSPLPEYIMRHNVKVVIKDPQVKDLISQVRERLSRDPQGGKIFVSQKSR